MKINHIRMQKKPAHPGWLLSWMENGMLKRRTVPDTDAGFDYVLRLLAKL